MFTATSPLINHLRHGAAMALCPTRRMRWPHWVFVPTLSLRATSSHPWDGGMVGGSTSKRE